MAAPHRRWAAEMLHVWFHKLHAAERFQATPAVDAMLRARFERELNFLWSRPAGEFLENPQMALAAVLLFDQVPRNLYRDSGRAFAFDPLARTISRAALLRGWDRALTAEQRQFLAMPLMHSEHISDQLWSRRYFTRLGQRHGAPFARSHYEMIARFGRFPHRNAVLGRSSTRAEKRAVEAGFSW